MPKQSRISSQQGFTLVELSVVIAIIGLMIGGVMAGQYMIRRSEMTGILSDLAKYKGAYQQFKDLYKAMPGDMVDATDYWGTDTTGTCPSGTRTLKKETCNGDGNNVISSVDSLTTYSEPFRAWQHLAGAGMIDGIFTGVAGTANIYDAMPGENVPKGKPSSSGMEIFSAGNVTGNASGSMYDANYKAVMAYGTRISGNAPYGGMLSAREMRDIDSKADDGKPASGIMLVLKSTYNANCTTADTSAATYLITNKGTNCSILYLLE